MPSAVEEQQLKHANYIYNSWQMIVAHLATKSPVFYRTQRLGVFKNRPSLGTTQGELNLIYVAVPKLLKIYL